MTLLSAVPGLAADGYLLLLLLVVVVAVVVVLLVVAAGSGRRRPLVLSGRGDMYH